VFRLTETVLEILCIQKITFLNMLPQKAVMTLIVQSGTKAFCGSFL